MIKHNAFSITYRFTLKRAAKTCNIRKKKKITGGMFFCKIVLNQG